VPELVQFGGQAAQAPARPAQRRHRIAARVGLDKRVQIVEQLAIRLGQRFPAASRTANAPLRRRLRRLEIFQAAPDRTRGDARNARHRSNPAMAGGFGFRGGKQTPLTFVEMRQHRRLALPERIFINHPATLRRRGVAGNPISVPVKIRFSYFPTGPKLPTTDARRLRRADPHIGFAPAPCVRRPERS
jgi:hypothetical protein